MSSALRLEEHYQAWYSDWLASVTEPPRSGKTYYFDSIQETEDFISRVPNTRVGMVIAR
jgi:hypothetical protein